MIRRVILFIFLLLLMFTVDYGYAYDNGLSTSSSFIQNLKDKFSGDSDNAKEPFSDNTLENGSLHDNTNNPFFNTIWRKFSKLSNNAIELAAGKNPFEKTTLEFVTLREPKYVRLLKEAQEILGRSEAFQQFESIEKLRAENKKLKSKITELKTRRVSAPESSMNPMAETRKSIDKNLIKLLAQIDENENRIIALKDDIRSILNDHGLNIFPNELDYFLVSAEGSDLIRLMTIAENMKKIQQTIERELQNDRNNIELAKVYAGMHLVSLDAYVSAHDTVIENIINYCFRISDIINEAKKNREDAKRLKKSVSGQDLANTDSNIRINERTIEVAGMYGELLKKRLSSLKKSRLWVWNKAKLARNTYKTIVTGSSLIKLVKDGSDEYLLLINFEIPELKNIYDDAMMSAFTEISEKIRNEK